MAIVFVALGAFLVGVGVTVAVARYFFLLGWEKGRDDSALDPGQNVGRLPAPSSLETTEPLVAVGVSSGRHAMPEWPTGDTAVRRAIDEDCRFVDTQDADDWREYEESEHA